MATSPNWHRLRRKGLKQLVVPLTSTSMPELRFIIVWTDVFHRVAETLPEEVLAKMHAPPKKDIPIVKPETLEQYDGFLLGIPTRYGSLPAQWKTFWDSTGKQWQTGGYFGKYAGVFVSTGGLGGGQEVTALAALSTFAHHSIIYVSQLGPITYSSDT